MVLLGLQQVKRRLLGERDPSSAKACQL